MYVLYVYMFSSMRAVMYVRTSASESLPAHVAQACVDLPRRLQQVGPGDFLAVVERVQEVGLLVDLRRAGEKHLRRCKRTASCIHTHTYINKT